MTPNLDLFRDSPARLLEAWRARAGADREQFPGDEKRAAYYADRIREIEEAMA